MATLVNRSLGRRSHMFLSLLCICNFLFSLGIYVFDVFEVMQIFRMRVMNMLPVPHSVLFTGTNMDLDAVLG